jgi:hypothetical protein
VASSRNPPNLSACNRLRDAGIPFVYGGEEVNARKLYTQKMKMSTSQKQEHF